MMREISVTAKQFIQDEFTCLPKLREFDWRLDVKISSKQSDRLKQPTLYVKMDLDSGTQNDDSGLGTSQQASQVLFQVSKGQLKELLNNFESIN